MGVDPKHFPLKVLDLIMRPIVRFSLRHALSFQDFSNTAKNVFISVAEEEIKKKTSKINVSRLSVMTGLYRKDVTKVFKEREEPAKQAPSILGRVLTHWEQDPRFTSRPGQPRALSFKGENSEFKKLVEAVTQHVHPGTLLFEMERIGAVKRVDDEVRLLKVYNRFDGDKEAGFRIVMDDLEGLIQAAEQNIMTEEETRNLHLRTTYDNIYVADIPKIRQWLLDEGKLFHKRARDFLSAFDKDVNPRDEKEKAGAKVMLGAFSCTEPTK